MPKVLIDIADGADALTLKVMLEADGCGMSAVAPDVIVTDTPEKAVAYAAHAPTLLVARAAAIPVAVAAMRKGVYGYIFLPYQPGEAAIMVKRAIQEPAPVHPPNPETIAVAERKIILDTLKRCKNNKSQAAKVLGIGRNTLWRKLKQIRGQPADGG